MITMHPQDLSIADAARALGHPMRVHLLRTLVAHPRLGVSELVERVQLDQPAVSRHLKILLDAHLVTVDREGRRAFYAANGAVLRKLAGALGQLATRAPE